MKPKSTRRALILALVSLGLVATVLVVVVVVHRHEASQERLHRDPSYLYGSTLMRDVIENQPGTRLSDEQTCRQAVASKPKAVTPYSPARAYQGCWDAFVAINR